MSSVFSRPCFVTLKLFPYVKSHPCRQTLLAKVFQVLGLLSALVSPNDVLLCDKVEFEWIVVAGDSSIPKVPSCIVFISINVIHLISHSLQCHL